MSKFFKLVEKTHANLTAVAGEAYADNVLVLAAQNADQNEDGSAFYEQQYLSLSGVLESLDAPASYYDAIA
jgi:hypothetical protein